MSDLGGRDLGGCDLAGLVVARHGQSVTNAAFAEAQATGTEPELVGRDADVELTSLGEKQATLLGAWLASHVPDVVISSPYRRAVRTTEIALTGLGRSFTTDPRLVDRIGGAFEMLHRAEIARRFPDEGARRLAEGHYRYRPPGGGESFMDIADRLRGVLAELRHEHAGRQVLIVAHDAIVLMFRFLLDDQPIDDLDAVPLADNASITRFENTSGRLRLVEYGSTAHLGSFLTPS